jgi:hypothetical protein
MAGGATPEWPHVKAHPTPDDERLFYNQTAPLAFGSRLAGGAVASAALAHRVS